MREKALAILKEVKKPVVGKDAIIGKILMTVLAQGHILLEDIPGVGKTTLALAFSRATNLVCKRMQFTADVMPTDVTGFSVYHKETGKLEYRPGAAMCNLFLADEINRTSSKTQSALLEVMEEGSITVDGITRETPKPYIVIATQNPVGSAGTQLLPESQLDRFMVRLTMGYPTPKDEVEVLKRKKAGDPLDSVCQVATAEDIIAMRKLVEDVYVADEIYQYIVRLTAETRQHSMIRLGASPRGSIALVNMGKASAWLMGRDYVVPEDIQRVFADVLEHRLVLSPQARIAGISSNMLLDEIAKKVEAPKIRSGAAC